MFLRRSTKPITIVDALVRPRPSNLNHRASVELGAIQGGQAPTLLIREGKMFMNWWKPFKKARHQAEPQSSAESNPAVPAPDEAAQEKHQFVSDDPIASSKQDRFNRAPFAHRVAETLARRPDPSSLVVGIFGPWGDGKTSVLKMMEERLRSFDHIIVVHFNPWHFPSDEQLIRGFFATLSEALGKQLSNGKERLGKLLAEYGSLLSLGSVAIGGVVTIQPGEAAKGLGESMSTVGLDDLRARIESALAQSGKRVVVLVDDIDRLDKGETHSMFKLVKLSAGFEYTAYVLAFDDEVVADALGERYGAGGRQAGRAFLEKIIQVPLRLPPVDTVSLRQVAFEGVDTALSMAGIVLTQNQTDAFVRHFIDGLEPRLDTPRVAKLYTNALMFALPLLKGEVNIMNLMLLEGIRVLYPTLYAAIRDNRDVFLKAEREHRSGGLERPPSACDRLVDSALPTLGVEERQAIKDRLLKPLFPRTDRTIYGGEWEEVWAKDMSICASAYFQRYFSYCVPDGDVSEKRVDALLEQIVGANDACMRELIHSFAVNRGIGRLVGILRSRSGELTPEAARDLARAVALSGELFPQERGMLILTTRLQAAILFKELIARALPYPERLPLIERLLQDATPLSFATECLTWVRHKADRGANRNVVEAADNDRLEAVIASRVASEFDAAPTYLTHGHDAPRLLWLWARVKSAEVQAAMRRRFDEHPAEVDAFLQSYIGEGWSMESGLPVPGDFEREHYDRVEQLVGVEYVMANLKARYGRELDNPVEYAPSDWPSGRRVAHQFATVYGYVLKGKAEAPAAPADPT